MSRPTKVPAYRKHSQSGQAVVTLSGREGRKDVYLGTYGTAESHLAYARVIAEWTGTVLGPQDIERGKSASTLTINQLILKFWGHAQTYYVKEGRPTSEQHNYRAALRPFRLLYGVTPACQFTPISLKALRQHYVAQNLCRNEVNRRVRLVRSVFKWGVAEGLVSAPVWEALRAVAGLKKGRSEARETLPIRPVEDSMIEAVLPHLPRIVADILRVQRLSGMRPGEVCAMRPIDINRDGPTWVYSPSSHKTDHHGKRRAIFLGPKCQAVLEKYLDRNPESYCFSPAEAEFARNALRSEKRVTPLWSSHQRRNLAKQKPKRQRAPGVVYTAASYSQVIGRACRKAYPLPDELARLEGESSVEWEARLGLKGLSEVKEWYKGHQFHPQQVRHRAATELRQQFGLETARAVLGHSYAAVSDHYSSFADGKLAADAATAAG